MVIKKLEPVILTFAMVFPTLLTFVYFVLLAGEPGTIQKIAFGIGKTLQFAMPVLWIAAVLKEPIKCNPFCRNTGRQNILFPVFFGSAVFTAMLGINAFYLVNPGGALAPDSQAALQIRSKMQGFGINSLPLFILLGLFYSVIHSGLEEYYWRRFVFKRMSSHIPWLTAAVLSSLGFMSHHILVLGTYFGYASPVCWLGSLGTAAGGFIWCLMYHKSRSLIGAWISHGIIDVAIFTLGAAVVFNT